MQFNTGAGPVRIELAKFIYFKKKMFRYKLQLNIHHIYHLPKILINQFQSLINLRFNYFAFFFLVFARYCH